MNDKVVLGIHSKIDPATQGSLDQFVDGHAWITVTRGSQTQYYGLWPDGHPLTDDNGPGTDIRRGMETRFTPSASRYYELSPEQERQLDRELAENVTWSYTNTCASWATATTAKVTGQRLDAGELMLTDTPRELIESIRTAERLHPTSPAHPQLPAEATQDRSSSSSLSGLSMDLHQQAIEGVHVLDATLGRVPDDSSERMAASLAILARAHGLERIDHVVLGTVGGPSSESQNVFVVQGGLNDPAHRRAHMGVDAALQPSVDQSLQRLQRLDQDLAVAQAVSEPSHAPEQAQHRQMG